MPHQFGHFCVPTFLGKQGRPARTCAFGLHLLAGETPDPYGSPRVAGRLRSRKPAANEMTVHEILPPREAGWAARSFADGAPFRASVKTKQEARIVRTSYHHIAWILCHVKFLGTAFGSQRLGTTETVVQKKVRYPDVYGAFQVLHLPPKRKRAAHHFDSEPPRPV